VKNGNAALATFYMMLSRMGWKGSDRSLVGSELLYCEEMIAGHTLLIGCFISERNESLRQLPE
jgi:hypothetical protein